MTLDTAWQQTSTPSDSSRRDEGTGLAELSHLAVALLGFLLPIMRHAMLGDRKVNLCAADLVLLPAVLCLRHRWLRSGRLGYWLFALWMVNLVSWNLSLSVLHPLVFVQESLKVATCFLYALVGFGIARELRTQAQFLKGLVASAVPIAAVGIYAFFSGVPQSFLIESRVAGTFTDANAFACYLAMLIPLIVSQRAGWVGVPLFLGAGLVSLSRTGLAALTGSLALSMIYTGLRRHLLIAVGCAAALLILWGSVGSSTVGRRLFSYRGTLEGRQDLWSLSVEVAQRSPILGIGKGNWEMVTRQKTIPHNTFLSVLVNSGMVGLAVFLVPLSLWLWAGLREPEARPWAIAVLAGLAGGIAVSLDNFRFFWLAVGALTGRLSPGADSRRGARRVSGGETTEGAAA